MMSGMLLLGPDFFKIVQITKLLPITANRQVMPNWVGMMKLP